MDEHFAKIGRIVPGFEHASAGNICKIDRPALAIIECKREFEILQRMCFNNCQHFVRQSQ
jgi:hypothetical protein